jgi:prepilin signal peptidase PulO-like enzyme (type II secretory pathway)
MTFIITSFFFIVGLVVGSFLNVVIFRYNTQRTFGGRSGCMACQNKLCWYELIPLISFLALKGRCKNCKTKISIQYPLVELTTAFIFVGLFLKFQDIFYFNTFVFYITVAYYAVMFSLLLVISIYDLRHKIIPDMLALILGILSFIGLFFFAGYSFNPHIPSLWEFLSGVIIAVPFALIWLISKGKWMGLGDAKLVIGIGWLVGIGRMLSGVVLSFWLGAIVGLLMIFFSRKYSIKSEIPFAPFLALGAILAFIFDMHLFMF